MVASPFEKIEARLKRIEEFDALQHAANAVTNRRICNAHKCVEALLKRVERIEHFVEQQLEVNVRLVARLNKKG